VPERDARGRFVRAGTGAGPADAPVSVELQSAEVTRYLSRLQARLGDLTPLMRDIAGVLEDTAQQAFADESDPVTGEPWTPLGHNAASEAYVHRPVDKGGRGGDYHPVLQREGDMAKPTTDHGSDYALVGWNDPQAARQNFGDEDYEETKKGIPPRPFAGLSEDGEQEIYDLGERYMLG